MIKNVVFDLGGVIINHPSDLMPRIIGEVFGVGLENGRSIWHDHKDKLLTGELPSRDFLRAVAGDVNRDRPMEDLMEAWESLYKQSATDLNGELLEYIKKLRPAYRTYLLTDTIEVHHAFNDGRGLYGFFDGVYASHLEGKSKSQGSNVFRHFLEKFRLQAGDCVFIDDMESYVDAAVAVGLKGVQFTTNARLLSNLQSLGVTV